MYQYQKWFDIVLVLQPFNIFSLVQTFCSLQKLCRFASTKGSKVVSDILWREARRRKMQISVPDFRRTVSAMELLKLFEESSMCRSWNKIQNYFCGSGWLLYFIYSVIYAQQCWWVSFEVFSRKGFKMHLTFVRQQRSY